MPWGQATGASTTAVGRMLFNCCTLGDRWTYPSLSVLVARNQELPTGESALPGGESVPVAAVPPVLVPARAKGPAKP